MADGATKNAEQAKQFLPQHQDEQPGIESEMTPRPKADDSSYRGSGKLKGKVAIITGGDSGIGRAVSIFFAREGANIAIVYLNEHQDAEETRGLVEKEGGRCIILSGDIGEEKFCTEAVRKTFLAFERLDILVNNAAEQHVRENPEDISADQLERTFRTNIFSQFFMTKASLKHMKEGSVIINSTSVTAYRGSPHLIDYASTKAAIVGFTRSLAANLTKRNIRVNAVAPGPVWTPLIPATFPEEKVEEFGAKSPMGRAGQPEEIAPSYVFLASDDSSFMTGQVLHPNGGEIVNG